MSRIESCNTDYSKPEQYIFLKMKPTFFRSGSVASMSEKIEEMSEKSRLIFQKLQGKVFHTIKNIGGQKYMNRYRIGEDGKLTLEEILLGSFLGGKEVQEILTKAGNDVSFI